MENKVLKVELISWREMHVTLQCNASLTYFHFELLKDGDKPMGVRLFDVHPISDGYLLKYRIDDFFELGHDYLLVSRDFNVAHLDVSKAVDFDGFDEGFTYTGKDLGATYFYDRTDFALWAPLANDVYLKYFENGERKLVKMRRSDKGVYRYSLEGDRDGTLYSYIVYLNGTNFEVIDPYAKSANTNCKLGAVINLNKIWVDSFMDFLPPLRNYVDATIYELNVRDFTIHPNSNIEHKGKFKGLVEPDRVTRGNNPAGIDYIEKLGVSHVQLLPVQKIATIDEENPDKTYNWGYDPYHYFVLEGSYSTNPEDPYSRIFEFKKLVREFHKRGIRVNLDVVYNHVYKVETSILNKITPYYFFRHDKDYKFSNHSYCGNDLASERPMARKLIIDSLMFILKTYGVDGFRFDLMGLLDATTMNEIARVTKEYKKEIMLYGEGWHMMDVASDGSKMANMDNADILPDYAFFNDRYRNIARGSGGNAKLDDNGYLFMNNDHFEDFKYIYQGSTVSYTLPMLFNSLNQSLNYVECHDNATLYDAIEHSTKDDEKEILQRIKLINKSLILSFGIPFIHAGQEIGLSKRGEHNTYNMGDKYNWFNYDVLDERYELSLSFANYIKQRKDIPYFKITSPSELDSLITYKEVNDSMFIYLSGEHYKDSFIIAINPSKNTIYYDFNVEVEQFIKKDKTSEKIYTKNAMIFPVSCKTFKY